MFSNLKNKRNLLAYSAGTDSSALFHMLTKQKIKFDLVMINYNTREQSIDEVNLAKKLAKDFDLNLHLLDTKLDLSMGNFEKRARDIRYDFFDKVMTDYDNLILGHNLSDKLEWFFMQLTRGAGLKELYGMNKTSARKNYMIVRPLLDMSKKGILKYLNLHRVNYFYDKSNDNEKFTRNYIRHNFSEKLLDGNESGILKTFSILEKEIDLLPKHILLEKKNEFYIYEVDFSMSASLLSSLLKEKGYLLSGPQREEYENKEEITIVFNNSLYNASYRNGKLYFSPYLKDIVINKSFKEEMRISGIPPKQRGYLFKLKS